MSPRDAYISTAEDAMLAIWMKVAAQRVKIKLRYRGEKHQSRHRGPAHTAAGPIATRPRLSIIINVKMIILATVKRKRSKTSLRTFH